MFVILNTDNTIRGASQVKPRAPYVEVASDHFIDYPQDCWEYNGTSLVLKADAEVILTEYNQMLSDRELARDNAKYTKVSPVQFKLLFTSAERIGIKTLKATNDIVGDFYEIVDDPRLTHIDFGLKSVRDAVAYTMAQLEASAVLNTGEAVTRTQEVLAGALN